ncbi:hypothetical protein KY284_024464 [Solanum tuberosum]|nr:hypothetical protein KY284_024464 [Solanum tuberosum]
MSELKDLLIVQGLVVEQIEMKTAEEVVNELISSSLKGNRYNIDSYLSSHSYAEPSHVTMTEDRLVELLDAILMYLQCLLKSCSAMNFTSTTPFELIQNVFGNLRDFHRLKVNGCVEYETIEYVLPHLQIMALRIVNFCFTLLDCLLDEFNESDVFQVNSKLDNLLVDVITVELEVMHICCTNLKGSKSEEVERFIKQLVEASPDILRVSLINLQEHMVNALTPRASTCNIHVMIEFLLIILTDVLKDVIRYDKLFVLLARVIELTKEKDLKNDFLKARADSSQLCFPMTERRPGNHKIVVEQELHRDLWTRVLDVAYEAEHAIHSTLARDHGLLQLIFILPDTVEKIELVKKEVQEKIPKSSSFEEETKWIIKKLTSGPDEIDVISIVGMTGLGKTTLAFRVYNDESIVDHFNVCAWCTVDQERNEKKLLQKIFKQVIGLKERFNENDKDDDVADKLRKQLFGKRYLIVLDDMWDTATLDELRRPFPELQKGSRVILTSRKKEVALHGKCHSDPLYLRLLRSEESWELFEKKVLDLIGGVISRKEKKEALWVEVLNNLSSFIFKDEVEVVKVIQLSYDHLSDHVKPCLVCLASYPKDNDIWMSELKDLLIFQGLVEQIEMISAEEVVNEKEKVFDFIGGSNAPSSSSNLIPRGIIICNNEHLCDLDENFVLFKPEKKNPYVKRLLSMKKVYDGIHDYLSYNSHLKHLRLLKSLDLKGITLTDSLLNEIGMLVHLKYLIISTKAKALPPSFSNLCNLEILAVDKLDGSCMVQSTRCAYEHLFFL